ncbi:transcriptional regulator TrmB [Paraburkholderia sp. 5N]|uniref:Transcriptional regulator TrmB n=2 Tax=Paraburkholderia elongata TaxID=2675747 RepID=A0A972NWK5_9BURK|nr:transcriptional regulator TrmB [Paraburkholderia elongata]
MSNSELFQTPGFEVIRDVAVRRIRAGINLRVIRSGPGDTRDLWRSSKRDLRELRFAPADFEVGITTYLYDDTVAFVSSRAEHYALSIQSAEFFAFECSLFEVLWSTSTPDRSDKPV